MKKNLIFLPLFALCLAGCNSGGHRHKQTSQPKQDDPEGYENYTERYRNKKDCFGNDVDDYHLFDSYGDDLAEKIHYYCVDQHKTFIVYQASSNNYKEYFKDLDTYPGSNKYVQFYTGKEDSSSGNREHVWPCAQSADLWYRDSNFYEHKIDSHPYWGGGSDLYNLHTCTNAVNTARGNCLFVEFSNRDNLVEVSDGGPYKLYMNGTGNRGEPALEYRGNIARLAMYMWCHYRQMGTRNAYYPKNYDSHKPVYTLDEAINQSGHSPYMFSTGLRLSLLFGCDTDEQNYALIKKWNKEDPPDEMEKAACDKIESKYQGNRNPFVDYPNLVDNILDWIS